MFGRKHSRPIADIRKNYYLCIEFLNSVFMVKHIVLFKLKAEAAEDAKLATALAFKQAIEDYSAKAEHYQADVCKVPQSVNLTFTEGAFFPGLCSAASGACGTVFRKLRRVCYQLGLLCSILCYHFHSAGKDYVCCQRYDAGQHGARKDQGGHGCACP